MKPSPAEADSQITVRHCHGLSESEACFELQRRVWGNSDIDVPVPVFVIAAETGGQVLGAFIGDDSSTSNLVGFTMAIAGWRSGKPFLHSHMTAVLPDHRDKGIGRKLKLFQREDALSRGIELVEWTFDPLEIKNAYFNFMRLGAIARRYLPNCYGITNSPLHGGLPTDRLIAEWWLSSNRVVSLLGDVRGQRASVDRVPCDGPTILVPAELQRLKHDAPVEALHIQSEIRAQFQKWFEADYTAIAIQVSPEGGRYLLNKLAAT